MRRLVASSLDGRYEGRTGFGVAYVDYYHRQMRVQVCTLTSTNVILGQLNSGQTETTALLQQVLTMLQQGQVRQRSRTLSMHAQVEPVGFNSQTTRVRHLPHL
jgi:hypothetical protein